MNIVVILIIIVGLLFAATYFTKRRYGVLGLALCAGYLLSTIWTADATSFVEGSGIELLTPPLSSVVSAGLVLLPAVLLLFSGPTYSKQWQRIVGAAAFALLATSFLLGSITHGLTFDATGQKIYDTLVDNRNLIVTLGVAYALYDILTLKTPKKKDEK
jgi:hypothetical protein